jgi:threonine/homoserine/homoserine lactone efflux protein
MLDPLIKGIIIGLTLSFLLGPAFFVLLQTSIHRGFKAGLLIALGIFISDITVLGLCLAGISQVLGNDPRQNFYFSLAGGIVMIIFGTWTYTRTVVDEVPADRDVPGGIKVPGPAIFILKGFFLNITNPGVWFVWLTTVVGFGSAYGVDNLNVYYLFAGALFTILAIDSLKCFIAHKIKSRLSTGVISWTNRIVGILLIVFGAIIIGSVFFDLKSMIPMYGRMG